MPHVENGTLALIGATTENPSFRFDSIRQIGGRIIVRSVSSLTRLDLTKKENRMLFVCSEAVESKLVNLVTSDTFPNS